MGTNTYDTVIANEGFALYSLSFPQFSPDSGQLVSVKLTANVSASYGFTLRNADTKAGTYQLNIGQEAQFSGSYGTPYLDITPSYVGTYTLDPGQSQTSPPFPFLTNHLSTDSITANVADFLGNGKVHVNYMSFVYTNLWANDHTSYFFSSAVNSTTQFSMQYLYCKAGIVLATDITRWTAILTAPLTAQLDWSVANETAGRQYEIQRSSDGHTFTTIARLPAVTAIGPADYAYTDHLPDAGGTRFYYRLQIIDNNRFTWSPIKEISVGAGETALRLYPNPATDHIDLATGTANSDWQVDILSASGGLVQREAFLQSNLLHLAFSHPMSTGTYFARVTDIRGQRVFLSSFLIVR
ncbi:MAG TPA: T9SS type A sorting domain-containing protein [Puia sp.]|nr:T9SS type A sorting domain-containing protein [Puia sp.]